MNEFGSASARAVVGRALGLLTLTVAVVSATGCDAGPELDTRTFEVQYQSPQQIEQLIAPYVFTDRENNPGMMSVASGAVTVRETPDNLEKIDRVLREYDRPKPTVMLTFQIIEADGVADRDPEIADVEEELRRLFRFEGYDLLAETQVAAIEGTRIRQMVGGEDDSRQDFLIEGGVYEVRRGGETTTLTLEVNLSRILETRVTVPAGHSVVLGSARAPGYDGAIILVVRADLVASGATEE